MSSLAWAGVLLAAAASSVRPIAGTGTDQPERAVADLWPELEGKTLERARWERLSAAAAAGLAPEQAAELLEITGDGRATPLERVAAAELLRRVSRGSAAPAAAELAWLRSAAFGGVSGTPVAGAARRVLAELGDWSDRLRLVRELAEGPDAEARAVAAWCLKAAGGEEELDELARLVASEARSPAPELAAAALEGILRRPDAPSLEDGRRAELSGPVLAALGAPHCPPELEQRCSSLLGVLGGEAALARLECMAREGALHAARALGSSPEGRRRLLAILRDPWAGDRGHLPAATALASLPADGALAAAGTAELARIAREGLESDQRRRAALALGAEGGIARAELERVAAGDPDAEVRSAALVTLAQTAGPTAALVRSRDEDPDPAVRALAARLLEALPRAP
jgi:hypothetical protein